MSGMVIEADRENELNHPALGEEQTADIIRLRTNMREVYQKKSRIYKLVKRYFDIVLSGVALVCLSPIFAITALAILLEDGRPVFFVQPRAGKDLKPFQMYKFRSMYKDADSKLKDLLKENEQTGHAFKIKNDPRITKVGKFIRKVSIDELPQLLNIIKGERDIIETTKKSTGFSRVVVTGSISL